MSVHIFCDGLNIDIADASKGAVPAPEFAARIPEPEVRDCPEQGPGRGTLEQLECLAWRHRWVQGTHQMHMVIPYCKALYADIVPLGYLLKDIPAKEFMSARPKHFITALCYQNKVECRFAILMAKAIHNTTLLVDGLVSCAVYCLRNAILFYCWLKKQLFEAVAIHPQPEGSGILAPKVIEMCPRRDIPTLFPFSWRACAIGIISLLRHLFSFLRGALFEEAVSSRKKACIELAASAFLIIGFAAVKPHNCFIMSAALFMEPFLSFSFPRVS